MPSHSRLSGVSAQAEEFERGRVPELGQPEVIVNWEDVDHTLVTPKLVELAEELHEHMRADEQQIRFANRNNLNGNTVPSLILKMKEQRADEWVRRAYDIYCDVWRTQGRAKCSSFVRAAFSRGLVPIIHARTAAIVDQFERWVRRTNFHGLQAQAHVTNIRLRMQQLEDRWKRRLEIEAKELEYSERAKIQSVSHASSKEAADASTWRIFHDRFKALADEELNRSPGKPDDRWLHACVAYKDESGKKGPEFGRWLLSEGLDEGFRARFDAEATRAGLALGLSQHSKPMDVWLHHVFSDLLDRKSTLLMAASKDIGGIIHRVTEASAIYCARLEIKVLESGNDGELERRSIAVEPRSSSLSKPGAKKSGRVPRLARDFVDFAGRVWLEAKHKSDSRVSSKQLRKIASKLDKKGYRPPADYLERRCAQELKKFNSHNSNSKTGAIKTWSGLVSSADKDHLRGMRRLLSRCAGKQNVP